MTNNPFAGCRHVDDVAAALEAHGVRAVHIGIFDIDARFRVKRVDTPKFLKLLRSGYEFCKVLYQWDTAELPYGQGSWADVPAPIDPTSGRLFPFAEGEAVFVAEFAEEIGDLAPRNLLRRQLDKAADMGFSVKAGFEYEYFILDETPATVREKGYRDLKSWQPGNSTYSLVPSIETDFVAGLEAVMADLDVHFDAFHTEQGPGCLETALKAGEGMRAADAAAFFKAYTKAYCQRQDLMATFMAKWSNATNGQSGHMHISMQDEAGAPVFHDAGESEGLSQTMRHFVGGLVRLLPETLAMCSHTVNAYRRMIPGIWAPLTATWGVQNRTCAFRIINPEPDATRVEFRVPAADANPHLTLTQCLGAGLWGIENRIEPPPPTDDEATVDDAPADQRLPRNLLEAAERLDQSAVAREIFGDPFVTNFARTRRWEDDVFRRHVSDLDTARYLDVF